MSEFITRATGVVIGLAVVFLFITWTDGLIQEAHQMLCDEGTLIPEHCEGQLNPND